MKFFILLFFLCFFTFSGCNFLRGGDDISQEDPYEDMGEEDENEAYLEDEGVMFTVDEEDEEEEEELSVEEDEEGEMEETSGVSGFFSRVFGGDSDEEEEEDEDEEMEETEKKKGGLSGFFKRMFDGDSDEEDEEFTGEDESFAEGDRDYENYEEEEEEESYTMEEDRTGEATAVAESRSSPPTPVPAPAPKVISLNKITQTPYKKAGYLVNAVYIARPGDTLSNIGQKIYGANKTDILRQINPHLQSRAVKVGDKIYYNSLQRPNDSSRLLFYYQDINAPSSVHVLSPGDNIREIASKLLGHPNSWKEIWATNPELVSKGEIMTRINIVYWPVASAEPQAPEPAPSPAPEEIVQMDEAPPEEPKMEEPVQEEAFPPSPPIETDMDLPKESKTTGIIQAIFKQKEAIVVLLGIILVMILMIRLMLKKRREKDFDYTATNIEV